MDNHDRVVTHSVSDILECEVKWTLGSLTMNKASGSDRILAELFKILKDDLICQQVRKTQQWPQDWSVSIPMPKRGNAKECLNYSTIAFISVLVRLSSKSFKVGFSST